MIAGAGTTLAEELTARFEALDGVRSVFPERPTAASVLALVTGTSRTGSVGVDESAAALRISARLATARAVPARAVIAAVVAAVVEVVGARPYELQLELAYID